MNHALTILLLAAALAAGTPSPGARIDPRVPSPKAPRDGPGAPDPLEVADDVELFAVCLEAGLPLAAAAKAVASAAGATTVHQWERASSLLGIGVPAGRAFSEAGEQPAFEELSRLVRRSTESGSAMAGGCRDLAEKLRSSAADAAVTRAERAGVLISLPLTGCFLPAFLILGLAPVLLSLGTELFL